MNRCTFCNTKEKERTKWVQCCISVPTKRRDKKTKKIIFKKINICQYPEHTIYCPSCTDRAKEESTNRHDPSKWMEYMKKNPVYAADLCGSMPVLTLRRLLFQERGAIR